jgi:hypothetical protein
VRCGHVGVCCCFRVEEREVRHHHDPWCTCPSALRWNV